MGGRPVTAAGNTNNTQSMSLNVMSAQGQTTGQTQRKQTMGVEMAAMSNHTPMTDSMAVTDMMMMDNGDMAARMKRMGQMMQRMGAGMDSTMPMTDTMAMGGADMGSMMYMMNAEMAVMDTMMPMTGTMPITDTMPMTDTMSMDDNGAESDE
jgi:hypothetical protein